MTAPPEHPREKDGGRDEGTSDLRLKGVGFDALQPKPVQPAQLFEAIAGLMGGSKGSRAA